MKKYLLGIIICSCMSCGSNNEREQSGETVISQESIPESGTAANESPAGLDGAKLIAESDCKACHAEKETIIGPAYQEVAERYPENDSTISYLATKIMAGGSGNWGSTPMPPHPQHSNEEVAAMASYILSLDN